MSEEKANSKKQTKPQHKALWWAFGFASLFVVLSIIALILESISSGKNSTVSPIRMAITSVKSVQSGLALETYKGISINQLKKVEPDLNWQTEPLNSKSNEYAIQFVNSGESVRLANRSDKNICYFVELQAHSATLYGSSEPNKKSECDAKTATIDSPN